MTLIIGGFVALIVVASFASGHLTGRMMGYRRGFKDGVDAASGRAVTPLRPKVEPVRSKPKRIPTWKRRGGDGGLAS